MALSWAADGAAVARYELELAHPPPETLFAHYPSMKVGTTGVQTALQRQVTGPEELDSLLQDVSSLGLVLTGVHLLSPPERRAGGAATVPRDGTRQWGGRSVTYEVRVAGALADRTLRFLRCLHYAIPERTLVRLTCSTEELTRLLRECACEGVTVERLRRVAVAA